MKLLHLVQFFVIIVLFCFVCSLSGFTNEALKLMRVAFLPFGSFGFFEEWTGLGRLAVAQG